MSKTKRNAVLPSLTCFCGASPKLIFACSGTSDAGQLADRAAKSLTKIGAGRMYCLAGISGRASGIMQSTNSAEKILVIDGCPLGCAANTLRQAGFHEFEHLRLCETGIKQESPLVCDVNIQKVVEKGRALLEGWAVGSPLQADPASSATAEDHDIARS